MPKRIRMAPETLERARQAIELMRKGWGADAARREVGISYETLVRALKVLGIHTKKPRKGRIRKRYIVLVSKELVMCVLDQVQRLGLPVYRAVRVCHTSVARVAKFKVSDVNVFKKEKGRWVQKCYLLYTYPVSFWGRLHNKGSPIDITHTMPLEDPQTVPRGSLLSNYSLIAWHLEFPEFHTTLSPGEVENFYLYKVKRWLKRVVDAPGSSDVDVSELLAEQDTRGFDIMVGKGAMTRSEASDYMSGTKVYEPSILEEVFRIGVELSDEVSAGVDDRYYKIMDIICSRKPDSDRGKFQVVVVRLDVSYKYPDRPVSLTYKHRVLDERK